MPHTIEPTPISVVCVVCGSTLTSMTGIDGLEGWSYHTLTVNDFSMTEWYCPVHPYRRIPDPHGDDDLDEETE